MKPTQTQVVLGVAAVTGVAAVATAWFFSTRRRCSAAKVVDLVTKFMCIMYLSIYRSDLCSAFPQTCIV